MRPSSDSRSRVAVGSPSSMSCRSGSGGGSGRSLLGVALATSPEPLELWVFARNEAALEFYRGHGFTQVERTDGAGQRGAMNPTCACARRTGRSRVQIRGRGSGDVEGIARAHVASWQGAYRGLLPPAELDALDWRFRAERWKLPAGRPWSRRASWSPTSGVGWSASVRSVPPVTRICTCVPTGGSSCTRSTSCPPGGGLGVGRRLWAAARSAIPAETSAVALWVLEGNVRARAFYERLGFRADGTSRSTARLGTSVSEIRFVWTISSD